MRPRSFSAVALTLAVVSVAGCGLGDDSPMARCDGGQSQTITDPARDQVRVSNEAATQSRSSDILKVTIATTNTMLCASIDFAAGDPPRVGRASDPPSLRRASLRWIVLELVDRPGPGSSPLSRVDYGEYEDYASWAPAATNDSDDQVEDVHIRGAFSDRVQIAMPISELPDVSAGVEYTTGQALNPRSFLWRVRVPSDCTPGPEQLIRFPSGARTNLDLPEGAFRPRCDP